GHAPATLDLDAADSQLVALREHKVLRHSGLPHLAFDPQADIVFNYGPALPGHANGLLFEALQSDGRVCVSETYYSIGGGFVVTASEREHPTADSGDRRQHWPYPFDSAAQMLQMA